MSKKVSNVGITSLEKLQEVPDEVSLLPTEEDMVTDRFHEILDQLRGMTDSLPAVERPVARALEQELQELYEAK